MPKHYSPVNTTKIKKKSKKDIKRAILAFQEDSDSRSIKVKERIVRDHNEAILHVRTAIVGLSLFVSSAELAMGISIVLSNEERRELADMINRCKLFYARRLAHTKVNIKNGAQKAQAFEEEVENKVTTATALLHIADTISNHDDDAICLLLAQLDNIIIIHNNKK